MKPDVPAASAPGGRRALNPWLLAVVVMLPTFMEVLDPLNPEVTGALATAQEGLDRLSGDPALSDQMSLQMLSDLRLQQSSALSYFDCFRVLAVLSLAL